MCIWERNVVVNMTTILRLALQHLNKELAENVWNMFKKRSLDVKVKFPLDFKEQQEVSQEKILVLQGFWINISNIRCNLLTWIWYYSLHAGQISSIWTKIKWGTCCKTSVHTAKSFLISDTSPNPHQA